jgi:hypothetical protein
VIDQPIHKQSTGEMRGEADSESCESGFSVLSPHCPPVLPWCYMT